MDHLYVQLNPNEEINEEIAIISEVDSEFNVQEEVQRNTTSKKRKREATDDGSKRFLWTANETDCLLDVWNEFKDKLEGTGPRSQTYAQMSEKMKDLGYERNEQQVQKKIANLRTQFRHAEKYKTGSSAKDFPYLEKMLFFHSCSVEYDLHYI